MAFDVENARGSACVRRGRARRGDRAGGCASCAAACRPGRPRSTSASVGSARYEDASWAPRADRSRSGCRFGHHGLSPEAPGQRVAALMLIPTFTGRRQPGAGRFPLGHRSRTARRVTGTTARRSAPAGAPSEAGADARAVQRGAGAGYAVANSTSGSWGAGCCPSPRSASSGCPRDHGPS
jgi:hypothetical protein